MRQSLSLLLLALLVFSAAQAQDERRVSSPNGQLEFRLSLAQPKKGDLFRLAYQVYFRGKRILDTSFLGLDIWSQEPVLGENVGLIGSKVSDQAAYHALVAEYMQNGSLGRLINIEARVSDDAVAFRYTIPRSTPLEEILLQDELTEFAFAAGEAGSQTFARTQLAFPVLVKRPEGSWIAIAEVRGGAKYPAVTLERAEDSVLITRLEASSTGEGDIKFQGVPPVTTPWRVILVGADKNRILESPLLRELNH